MEFEVTLLPLASLFSLEGRRALVTGATGYLGRAMCKALAEAGAHVLVNGRDEAKVSTLVGELRATGGSADGWIFDVTDPVAVEHAFVSHELLPLHVLVNNAYVGGAGSLATVGAQDYRDSFEVTLVAADALLRAAMPALRAAVAASEDASVINVASMYGMVSPDPRIYADPHTANPPFYGAAKAALLQWTRYAACELGPKGIRVNSLSPGPFPSLASQAASPAFMAKLASKVPLGRIGCANEVGGPLVFLASSASSYVNGANLVVDGGWTSW